MGDTIPVHILKAIRQRIGLDENDNTHDQLIAEMSPMNRLRYIARWELGDEDWADIVIDWARDCGMEIDRND